MVVLELSGSECVEVRERSLRLLMLSLSTADGKVSTFLNPTNHLFLL